MQRLRICFHMFNYLNISVKNDACWLAIQLCDAFKCYSISLLGIKQHFHTLKFHIYSDSKNWVFKGGKSEFLPIKTKIKKWKTQKAHNQRVFSLLPPLVPSPFFSFFLVSLSSLPFLSRTTHVRYAPLTVNCHAPAQEVEELPKQARCEI